MRKQCLKCLRFAALSEFGRYRRTINQKNRQRDPKRALELQRRWKKENAGVLSSYKKTYYEKNAFKHNARMAVQRAINSGKLIRGFCTHCSSNMGIEAHHWSYEKEYRLDVIWLCRSCHLATHDNSYTKIIRKVQLDAKAEETRGTDPSDAI